MTISTNYTLEGRSLSRCKVVHELVIYNDGGLMFDEHVDTVIEKASRVLGFMMRISKCFTEAKTLIILQYNILSM